MKVLKFIGKDKILATMLSITMVVFAVIGLILFAAGGKQPGDTVITGTVESNYQYKCGAYRSSHDCFEPKISFIDAQGQQQLFNGVSRDYKPFTIGSTKTLYYNPDIPISNSNPSEASHSDGLKPTGILLIVIAVAGFIGLRHLRRKYRSKK